MANLLAQTRAILEEHGKSPADVRHVSVDARVSYYDERFKAATGSWADFERLADIEYDDGYGGANIAETLVVVGDDWWLERGEYDGSEWWEFKTKPGVPDNAEPLTAESLSSRRY